MTGGDAVLAGQAGAEPLIRPGARSSASGRSALASTGVLTQLLAVCLSALSFFVPYLTVSASFGPGTGLSESMSMWDVIVHRGGGRALPPASALWTNPIILVGAGAALSLVILLVWCACMGRRRRPPAVLLVAHLLAAGLLIWGAIQLIRTVDLITDGLGPLLEQVGISAGAGPAPWLAIAAAGLVLVAGSLGLVRRA